MANWRLPSEIEPNYDGGLMKSKWLIGGIKIVKTKSHRNSIKALYRYFTPTETTLCFVESDNALYRLISNPLTDSTTDTNWERVNWNGVSTFTPVGTWDPNNLDPVLTDANAAGRNGEFYFIINTPVPDDITIANLFGGEEVTVADGNMVVSVGTRWVVISNSSSWDALAKPQVITDYVNGIVIDHTHTTDQISDLADYLQNYLTSNDVANHLANFNDVDDSAIISLAFLKQHYYTSTEIDNIITSISGGGGALGLDDAIVDGITNRAPSQNAVFDALVLKLNKNIDFDLVTGTVYEFKEEDNGKTLHFINVLGCLAVIPVGLSIGWSVGIFRESTAGDIEISSDGTLQSTGTILNIAKTGASIYHYGSDIHVAVGSFDIPGGGVLTDGSGTTANGTAVDLGGTLSADVEIRDDVNGTHLLTIGQYQNNYLDGIEMYAEVFILESVSANGISLIYRDGYLNDDDYQRLDIGSSGISVLIGGTFISTFSGIQYSHDFSANFTARSLVDKQYVDDAVAGATVTLTDGSGTTASGTAINLGGVLTGAVSIDGDGNDFSIYNTSGLFLTGSSIVIGQDDAAYSLSISASFSFISNNVSASNLTQVFNNVLSPQLPAFDVGNDAHWVNSGQQNIYQLDTNVLIKEGYEILAKTGDNIEVALYFEIINSLADPDTTRVLEITKNGARYLADLSASYTNRSLVDKEYVDTAITGAGGWATTGTTTLTGNVEIDGDSGSYSLSLGTDASRLSFVNIYGEAAINITAGIDGVYEATVSIDGNISLTSADGPAIFIGAAGLGFPITQVIGAALHLGGTAIGTYPETGDGFLSFRNTPNLLEESTDFNSATGTGILWVEDSGAIRFFHRTNTNVDKYTSLLLAGGTTNFTDNVILGNEYDEINEEYLTFYGLTINSNVTVWQLTAQSLVMTNFSVSSSSIIGDVSSEILFQISDVNKLRIQDGQITTSTFLRLHNDTADPTGAEGLMYLNTTGANRLRVYEEGAWKNVIGYSTIMDSDAVSWTQYQTLQFTNGFDVNNDGVNGRTLVSMNSAIRTKYITFVIKSATAITTGEKTTTRVIIPYSGTIIGWKLIADQSSTTVLDVWKDTTIPTNADSITASAKPGITAAEFATGSALTGWTTAVAANDILVMEVESNNNATYLNLVLTVQLD